jgi:hypothetical protein
MAVLAVLDPACETPHPLQNNRLKPSAPARCHLSLVHAACVTHHASRVTRHETRTTQHARMACSAEHVSRACLHPDAVCTTTGER